MRKSLICLAILGLLALASLPVAAGLRWCEEGTPPGLGAKSDSFPAFTSVQAHAGFSLHAVEPFSGNTAKTGAAVAHNPVDPATLPANAVLGPH